MKQRNRFLATGMTLALLCGGAALSGAEEKARPKDPLDIALERRATGKLPLDDIEVEASWLLEKGGNRSTHIWGDGVGVWEKSVQFSLSRAQVLEVVKMLVDARVGAMRQPGSKAPGAGPTRSPLQLRGELLVTAGDDRTQLQQLTKGEQSEPLSNLVRQLLALSERAAAGGTKASNLQDGLTKVADGKLAPQTFSATVRRQTTATKGEGDSFHLRMEGRHVTDRMMPRGQKPPAPLELTLSDQDFRKLVAGVRAEDPASFAKTTYAPTYTDVTIAVLDYDRNIPARPYLDVTAETHGEKQKAFDRAYALFRELHERVQKEGTPVKGAAPAAAVHVAPMPPASPVKP